MDLAHLLVPLALFGCVTYAFKVTLDAVVRHRMLSEQGADDLSRAMLAADQERRRLAPLRAGLFLVAVAIGFAIIEAVGWKEITAGVVAVLAAVAGLANLIFYWIARRKG